MKRMGQCESMVFFPDHPAQRPQFSGCPREAETTRRTWRLGDRTRREPMVIHSVVKLCGCCAREWDASGLDKTDETRDCEERDEMSCR
jgi:hypothetical protein